jgi:hypothetical protein
MGGGSFNHDTYTRATAFRKSAPVDDIFTQNAVHKIHPTLDPKGVKVRESCDSPEHPESNAVAIWFDQTGSMGEAPTIMARKTLGSLMRILLAKGYLDHPQILFGAFGDYSDGSGIIQVGQFESDNRMDDCLTNIWLVGKGGGQSMESSEMAMYFTARHAKIDCFEKRGKKGYMFIVTDEFCYPMVSADQANDLFGDSLERNIPVESILAELREKWEVFLIYLTTDSYMADGTARIKKAWQAMFGERMLDLPSASLVSDLIATTIGLCEGREIIDITRDLASAGTDPGAIDAVTKAVIPYSKTDRSRSLARADVSGSLPPAAVSHGSTRRL